MYELAVRLNYSSRDKDNLIDMIGYIKGLARLLKTAEKIVAPLLRTVMHRETQELVQHLLTDSLLANDLLPTGRRPRSGPAGPAGRGGGGGSDSVATACCTAAGRQRQRAGPTSGRRCRTERTCHRRGCGRPAGSARRPLRTASRQVGRVSAIDRSVWRRVCGGSAISLATLSLCPAHRRSSAAVHALSKAGHFGSSRASLFSVHVS
eukprot:SAG31_NODE_3487_length_4209_cov_3.729684_1_plen_207_part_00